MARYSYFKNLILLTLLRCLHNQSTVKTFAFVRFYISLKQVWFVLSEGDVTRKLNWCFSGKGWYTSFQIILSQTCQDCGGGNRAIFSYSIQNIAHNLIIITPAIFESLGQNDLNILISLQCGNFDFTASRTALSDVTRLCCFLETASFQYIFPSKNWNMAAPMNASIGQNFQLQKRIFCYRGQNRANGISGSIHCMSNTKYKWVVTNLDFPFKGCS